MALKDIVKGICSITRCKYDVYTKEKTDELLEEVNNSIASEIPNRIYVYEQDITPGAIGVLIFYDMKEGDWVMIGADVTKTPGTKSWVPIMEDLGISYYYSESTECYRGGYVTSRDYEYTRIRLTFMRID